MLKIAIIGAGYWGPNLVRNLAAQEEAAIVTICDLDARLARKVAAHHCPNAKILTDANAAINDSEVDAVVVATPIVTHFELAKKALESGKHVLVEKPLARTVEECEELVELSERKSLVLMVGHTFEYNPVVRDITARIESGEVGQIFYIHGQRVNLGRIQKDSNALWSFAPHDISILQSWLKSDPVGVSAHGYSYLTPNVEDVVFVNLEYPGNIGVNLSFSWLSPQKLRQMTVVGSKRMLVFDDVSMDNKLQIHDKSVNVLPERGVGYSDLAEFQLSIRRGDVHLPNVQFTEPLALECADFIESISLGRKPLSDGLSGLRVTRVLAAAAESLASGVSKWIKIG